MVLLIFLILLMGLTFWSVWILSDQAVKAAKNVRLAAEAISALRSSRYGGGKSRRSVERGVEDDCAAGAIRRPVISA
jgi:hypothetical protein